MAMLKDSDREAIRKELAGLTGPVKLINFTQELECQYCRETNQILREVSEISVKITFETFNFVTDKEIVDKYKIDKIPATVVMGPDDRGIRFYGIPSGYEFISLIEDIKMVSSGNSGLQPKAKEVLAKLKSPLHMQVFVTPT
jgi:glutaredoxin-like protein